MGNLTTDSFQLDALTPQLELLENASSVVLIAWSCLRPKLLAYCMTEDDWQRQEVSFGLLRKVYEQRERFADSSPFEQW